MNLLRTLVIACLLSVSTFVYASVSEAACPTEFVPEDSGWVLIYYEAATMVSGEQYYHIQREFSYHPGPWKRIRGEFLEQCKGLVVSYVIDGKEHEYVRVFLNGDRKRAFLLKEDGTWREGVHVMTKTQPYKDLERADVVIVLYDEARNELDSREVLATLPKRALSVSDIDK